jgi:hypothetical protein
VEEVKEFLKAVDSEEKAAFDPSILLQSAMYSSLCGALFGKRIPYRYGY